MPVRITTVFTLVLIHDFDDPRGRHVFVNAGGVVDVVMHIDHVELCPGDLMGGDVKHGDRMKISQQKGLLLFRVGGGLVSDLAGVRRRIRLGPGGRHTKQKQSCQFQLHAHGPQVFPVRSALMVIINSPALAQGKMKAKVRNRNYTTDLRGFLNRSLRKDIPEIFPKVSGQCGVGQFILCKSRANR